MPPILPPPTILLSSTISSLFSPFLWDAHDYVYAISSFPPWLLCTTQNRCAAVVGASTA